MNRKAVFVLGLCLAGAAALAVAAGPAIAQAVSPVVAAQRAGQVGERYDGYMDFIVQPAATLRRQVEAINIKRRALYSNLAARRGVTPQDVGITAGCETLAAVPVGGAYMLPDGVWRRRAAGQAAPVPDYCIG